MADYPFRKGHGTENDFVLLPDHDGAIHGDLTEEQWVRRVAALCDRRAGIGADGVIRVVGCDAGWFMDYRNHDVSLSEMCGNGIRVMARYLLDEGLVGAVDEIPVDTRDGVKTLWVADDGLLSVAMGRPRVRQETKIVVDSRSHAATVVDMGNPHAVVVLDDLAEAGSLLEPPSYDAEVFPDGVNVEFVVRRGDRHLAMRVHERGSGETRSCGTGACAVQAAVAVADHGVEGARPTAYDVDVPGGRLHVAWTADDQSVLTGPAVIVARGTTSL